MIKSDDEEGWILRWSKMRATYMIKYCENEGIWDGIINQGCRNEST